MILGRPYGSRAMKRRNSRARNAKSKARKARIRTGKSWSNLSSREQNKRMRCLEALNLFRRGKAKSLSTAARWAGTTVSAIRESVPAAIVQKRAGGRIRVKSGDPYSANVQILTQEGAINTVARGSRERELAGQHRATVFSVLSGLEPPSALRKYRRKKIGGHRLVSDYQQLLALASADVVGQLDALYVVPDLSA